MSRFKVKVVRDKYMKNLLSITHNGCQWTSVSVGNDKQTEKVIQALNEYMDERAMPPITNKSESERGEM